MRCECSEWGNTCGRRSKSGGREPMVAMARKKPAQIGWGHHGHQWVGCRATHQMVVSRAGTDGRIS